MTTLPDGFIRDLAALINHYSLENRSNTPDYQLAGYLGGCLIAYEAAVNERERWYGRGAEPIGGDASSHHQAALAGTIQTKEQRDG